MKGKFWYVIFLSAGVSFFATSCDKENMDERPELPPLESLLMDFSDFNEQPAAAKSTAVTYENFTHSYLNVAFWNTFATVTLALPVTAYGYALQQEPEYVGDHTWEWKFDFTWANVDYTATLTGQRLNNEEFSMEMVIGPAIAGGQGVKWFDGVVRYDHTHAEWNLYKSQGTVRIIEVIWNKDYETEAGDITYTYVEPDQEETGSFIMFEHAPGSAYDASYTISLSTGTVYIEWSMDTKEGRVKDEVKFGDTGWHCWDSNQQDTVCS